MTDALDDGTLMAQARRLDTRTFYGAFRLDPVTGLQVGHESGDRPVAERPSLCGMAPA